MADESTEISMTEAEMSECEGDKVVTMMDVLKEQQDFEEDANAVLGASDDKNCTFPKGYIKRQALYACVTCCPDAKEDSSKRAGICLACSLNCHENHELVELYTKRNFRCDCGNPKFNSHPCQFTPNKTDLNDENSYNQNFSGLYCVCHRPYPDPDLTEEDEMIQCIVCEDWLHFAHLEAVVPAHDQYSEMICKACMEKNDFLYDYVSLAINAEEEINITIDSVKDASMCNGNGVEKVNGLSNLVEGKDNLGDNDDSLMKSLDDTIATLANGENASEKVEENSLVNSKQLDTDAELVMTSDNKSLNEKANATESMEVTPSESEPNVQEKPPLEDSKEVESKIGQDSVTSETKEQIPKEIPDLEGSTEDEVRDNNKNDENISEEKPDVAESCKIDLPNTAPNGEINAIEKPIASELSESDSMEKVNDNDVKDDAALKEQETGEGEKGSDTTEKSNEVNSAAENEETNDIIEKEVTEAGAENSISNSASNLAGITKETDNKVTPESNGDTEMKESKEETEGESKENKRKHEDEENEEITSKKTKLSCIRPKGSKKSCHGAMFWPSNFRNKLCTCNECLSMYKDLSVLFLIDPEDTVFAYESLGKANLNGTATQYEKGLQALSSLDRTQQINAMTEYNNMRDKLLDFLKSFKDRKEIVKEEDIKAFFAGMKAKREPDGVYFCR